MRYTVDIMHLTYKGYTSGDIPLIRDTGAFSIYANRDQAYQYFSIRDIDKKFYDLCTDFGLTKEGEIIPKDEVVQCDDF